MSQHNPVCIGYVPPPTFTGASAFYENIRRFRTAFPLLLFSDHDYGPEVLRLKTTPEIVKAAQYPNGVKNVFSISNLLFFTALRIIEGKGFTHLIYVESDCRVGCHEWDKQMWEESRSSGLVVEPIAAGSVVGYSTSNAGLDFCRAWNRFVRNNAGSKFPVPSYGGNGAAESHEPAVFTNGALGIYDLAFIRELWPDLTDTAKLAGMVTAWDYFIGREMYRRFKEKTFDRLVHLDCVYSGYGDGFTTPEQRQQWLLSGEIVAVHQIKSNWPGPMESVHGNLDDRTSPTATDTPDTYVGIDDNPDDPIEWKFGVPASQVDLHRIAEGLVDVPTVQVNAYLTVLKAKAPTVHARFKAFMNKDLTAPVTADTSPIETQPVSVVSGEPKAPTSEAGAVTVPKDVMEEFARDAEPPPPVVIVEPVIAPVVTNYRVDILIVTHGKDAKWLALALASIKKFCRGFGGIIIVSPAEDSAQINPVIEGLDLYHREFNQAEGKGHLHHMVQKCMADLHCPDADLILHTDSDCIFDRITRPEDYFHAGKPILLMTPYSHTKDTHRGHYGWKAVTEQVLKEPVHYSTMERHPAVHWRELYPAMRGFIESRQGMKFEDYVLATAPVFPFGFCEFTALGAFALRSKEFVDRYKFIDTTRFPRPEDHLIQFWSHGSIDEPQLAPSTLPSKYPRDADGKIVPRVVINDILEIK